MIKTLIKLTPGAADLWWRNGVYVHPVKIMAGFTGHDDMLKIERQDPCVVRQTVAHYDDLYANEFEAVTAAMEWAEVSLRHLQHRAEKLAA